MRNGIKRRKIALSLFEYPFAPRKLVHTFCATPREGG